MAGAAIIDTNPAGFINGLRQQAAGAPSYAVPLVLAHSGVAVPLTGTTVLTPLVSVVVPGGLLGPNGQLRITTQWSATNNANNKRMSVALGGQSIHDPGLWASWATLTMQSIMRNRGAAGVQLMSVGGFNFSGYGVGGNAFGAGTIDTTQAQTLTISGTLAVATDTLTLEGYTIEVMPG